MTRYKRFEQLFWILMLSALLLSNTEGTTFIVSPSYLTYYSIQETVNEAKDGDRIIVKSGTYFETINVTKKVFLLGVDSGGGIPIVDAANKRSGITLMADGIRLEGFRVLNARGSPDDAAIMGRSNNNLLRGNVASNSSYGIFMLEAHNNTLVDNLVERNDFGISLTTSTNNTLENNIASNNSFGGLYLGQSENNSLLENTAFGNTLVGIFLRNSTHNKIEDNLAEMNENEGVWLLNSSHNLLIGNRVTKTYLFGIRLVSSLDNVLSHGEISHNMDGLCLESSSDNIIFGNNVSSNHYGIYMDSTGGNMVYLNNFADNVDNVYAWNSTDLWNSTKPISYEHKGLPYWGKMGNFWKDYSFVKADPDGIGADYIRGLVWDHKPLLWPTEFYKISSALSEGFNLGCDLARSPAIQSVLFGNLE